MAKTSAGRSDWAMRLAMVKVLPEPVMPSSTWCGSFAAEPVTERSNGSGLVPRGLEFGDETKQHELHSVARMRRPTGVTSRLKRASNRVLP